MSTMHFEPTRPPVVQKRLIVEVPDGSQLPASSIEHLNYFKMNYTSMVNLVITMWSVYAHITEDALYEELATMFVDEDFDENTESRNESYHTHFDGMYWMILDIVNRLRRPMQWTVGMDHDGDTEFNVIGFLPDNAYVIEVRYHNTVS